MSEKPPPVPPDYDALAKRYLDLWQEQIAKLARDPSQLAGAAATWSQMAAAMTQGAAFKAPPHDSPADNAPASGTEAASAAPGDRGLDLANVLKRIDSLERRMAALESAQSGPAPVEHSGSDKPGRLGARGGGKNRRGKP